MQWSHVEGTVHTTHTRFYVLLFCHANKRMGIIIITIIHSKNFLKHPLPSDDKCYCEGQLGSSYQSLVDIQLPLQKTLFTWDIFIVQLHVHLGKSKTDVSLIH